MITTVSFKDALLSGAREVFETMVFMGLEESSEQSATLNEEALLGTITFKGKLEGCLGFCCTLQCAQIIAANMLGMDSNATLTEDDINDAIGEIANMVMGALKTRIQDGIGTIEVSIPSVVQGRQLRNSLGEGSDRVLIQGNLDGHPAELSLLYREGVH
jgi:chemotaxis protein CheX